MKRLLRYAPRRAMLHKYPLVGRFAEHLRPRSYLWSFRRPHVWRAYYAGSVLSLLPVMGVQLPLALLLAVLLRSNFMVLGGLQFITNPVTAAPIYFATHQLGAAVINRVSPAPAPPAVSHEKEIEELVPQVADTLTEPITAAPPKKKWTTRVKNAVSSMMVGGVLVGVLLGLVLNVLDRLIRRRYALRHPPVKG